MYHFMSQFGKPPQRQEPRFVQGGVEEEEKLLLASNLSFMHDLVILLVDTGMRLGEALAITNKDIDFDRNIIVLSAEIKKSEKTRSVPMTKRVREMLSPMAGISDKVPVFNLNKDAVERLKVKKEAGYADAEGMVLHALRHTYASRLVQAGVELFTVKELALLRSVDACDANSMLHFVGVEDGDSVAVGNLDDGAINNPGNRKRRKEEEDKGNCDDAHAISYENIGHTKYLKCIHTPRTNAMGKLSISSGIRISSAQKREDVIRFGGGVCGLG